MSDSKVDGSKPWDNKVPVPDRWCTVAKLAGATVGGLSAGGTARKTGGDFADTFCKVFPSKKNDETAWRQSDLQVCVKFGKTHYVSTVLRNRLRRLQRLRTVYRRTASDLV